MACTLSVLSVTQLLLLSPLSPPPLLFFWFLNFFFSPPTLPLILHFLLSFEFPSLFSLIYSLPTTSIRSIVRIPRTSRTPRSSDPLYTSTSFLPELSVSRHSKGFRKNLPESPLPWLRSRYVASMPNANLLVLALSPLSPSSDIRSPVFLPEY